jgi:hypothetical protein
MMNALTPDGPRAADLLADYPVNYASNTMSS